MARPPRGSNLSIAELQRMLTDRQSQLEKLTKARTEAEQQLASINAEIKQLDGGPRLGRPPGSGNSDGTKAAGSKPTTGRKRPKNDMSLVDVIESALKSGGKPMQVGEIVDAVKSAGYKSNSANFRGIVNQALIKDERFGAASRGLYQLKK